MPWAFTSHEQLQAAGYTWQGLGACSQCMQKILWYRNVDRRLVPVDPGTYLIHFASCEGRKAARIAQSKVIDIGKRRSETRSFNFDADVPA